MYLFIYSVIYLFICLFIYFQDTQIGYDTMGLYKQYFRLSQYAKNQVLGVDRGIARKDGVPFQMLVSQHFSHSK